ncbi:MAG: hypothetical protein PHQ86_07980 [Dehalococcoidales bacterium]|nr:hypothetical protein [Dehalococcoidales bacterium]
MTDAKKPGINSESEALNNRRFGKDDLYKRPKTKTARQNPPKP